eukprot:GFUD01085096.1.p1 GENE.GFUD01085096.1~~GFUD01085096.1.p1  ORF type:complete len:409 (+),score=105.81 GFUD01085096.1:686-1912(+)
MGTRNPEKEMLKTFGSFDTCMMLVDSTLNSTKTKPKKLYELKDKLETLFYSFDEAYRVYRADVIFKEAKTEEAFNANDEANEEVPAFPKNDTWSKLQFTRYFDKTESIEEKIEALEELQEKPSTEDKPEVTNQENVVHVVTELQSEKVSLGRSIESFVDEVNACVDIAQPTAEAMEKFAEKLKMRLEDLKQKSRKVDDDLREKVNEFCNTGHAKIDSILLQLCKKLRIPPSSPELSTSVSGKQQVHLEKSKPPRFRGDEVEYPEFKRKWLSTVSKANLPQESEVDKLRDAIPPDAKDQLYGVNDMVNAWLILDKRYGDKKIIAMKLKTQLKTIQAEGKTDPARVLSLAIKVRTLVNKLKTMDMSDTLKHDSEFLSAVYCALPDKHQTRWLEYQKTDCHWNDMTMIWDN